VLFGFCGEELLSLGCQGCALALLQGADGWQLCGEFTTINADMFNVVEGARN
jgi:hypothetical protein